MEKKIITKNEKETFKLGKLLGAELKGGEVVALIGELGSGKTVFTKGIARGIGIKDAEKLVNSPSFMLIKEYPAKINLFHFDLYRLDSVRQIEQLGWEDYLGENGVLVIEWADKMGSLLPENSLFIELEVMDENKRKIKLTARGEAHRELIWKLKNISFR
ncbi:MAG: tRNA (adenosine(37)-N6)-threonylcarbamoyltransferase complex ATPase subunit type 1 TsaE [Candidatus Omnitrophica bacterium]|nr:tRNA (adenosine(37)-N6)-threonylcarbamoyltransferase complex ATPase subunit type 1 TsaE [Candidatus Omnitrophota bacterium]